MTSVQKGTEEVDRKVLLSTPTYFLLFPLIQLAHCAPFPWHAFPACQGSCFRLRIEALLLCVLKSPIMSVTARKAAVSFGSGFNAMLKSRLW